MNLAINLQLKFLLFVINLWTKWFLPRLTFSLSSANDGTSPKFKAFECRTLFTFLNIPNSVFIALLEIIRQKMDYSSFNGQLLETFWNFMLSGTSGHREKYALSTKSLIILSIERGANILLAIHKALSSRSVWFYPWANPENQLTAPIQWSTRRATIMTLQCTSVPPPEQKPFKSFVFRSCNRTIFIIFYIPVLSCICQSTPSILETALIFVLEKAFLLSLMIHSHS